MNDEITENYEHLRMDREWSHETLAGHLSALGAHREAAYFRAKGAEMSAQDEAPTPTPADEAPKARRAPKTEKA